MTTTLNRIHNSVFQWRLNISWTIFGGRRLLQKWMKRSWHLQVPQFRGGRHSFLHLLISVSKAIEVTSWNKPRGSCLSGHDHEPLRLIEQTCVTKLPATCDRSWGWQVALDPRCSFSTRWLPRVPPAVHRCLFEWALWPAERSSMFIRVGPIRDKFISGPNEPPASKKFKTENHKYFSKFKLKKQKSHMSSH